MAEKAKLLAVISGGIGDQITAEPSLRFALNQFKDDIDISILAPNPALFSHLKFAEVFSTQGPHPDFKQYPTVRGTYPLLEPGQIDTQPVCPFNTSAMDYCFLNLLKWQLPFKDRQIFLVGEKPEKRHDRAGDPSVAFTTDAVIIHPGMSGTSGWQSKDIPVSWWGEVVDCIARLGGVPVIIGKDCDGTNGVAKLSHPSIVDLTNKLNIKELIYLLQRCRVVVTNDSLLIHAAASCEPDGGGGTAWIGMIATARHPDFLMHWRHGVLGWQMENMSKGGMWSKKGIVPDAKTCTAEEMKSWLPIPSTVARWAVMKTRE